MAYTLILFITRNPTLTSDEFRDHYEYTHIPLCRSLIGAAWPTTFRRRYLARIHRAGFGGPANPDHPLLTLRGDLLHEDYDCIAELSFASEPHFQLFYRSIYAKENAAVLAKDEERFLEPGKTRAVVVGETMTEEHGRLSHEIGRIPKITSPASPASSGGS